jgi:hypothetical protein
MTATRPGNEAIFHAARAIPDPDRRREFFVDATALIGADFKKNREMSKTNVAQAHFNR